MSKSPHITSTQHGRQRLVEFALRVAQGTALEPQAYERELLEHFVHGDVELEQLVRLLDRD